MTGSAGVPLIFVRVRVRSRDRLAEDLRRSRPAAEQMAVIGQWASGAECTLMALVNIAVTRAPASGARRQADGGHPGGADRQVSPADG